MNQFIVPDLGEGLQEVEIIAWHVSEGDYVVADQPLVSVETEKAIVEIPSPHSGTIAKIFGKPGDVIKIGSPLVEFQEGVRDDKGAIVGDIPKEQSVTNVTSKSIKVTPAVRALAQRLKVDLEKITPNGPNGTITAQDVNAAASGHPFEPLKGVRRAMAKHMSLSHAAVVPVTLMNDADIERWYQQDDITIRLISAIIVACEAVPELNAWYENEQRCLHKNINLGIAMDTEEGLFVPVLNDVESIAASELRKTLDTLKEKVRTRAIKPEELQGQTFTLTNFGMLGGRYSTPIVVPPQVAILGAGSIKREIVAVDDKPEPRWILPLSLTFDHRAITGSEAARFMTTMIAELEKVSL
jgi:pyruvate dehydrogenase E2 component (dihydrolipoamide acetyltransferase)